MFDLVNQSLFYGDKEVVHTISLSVKRGEKVALLGKSGSGKSTLLKHLFKITNKESAYIPQDLSIVDNLSTFHNVYMGRVDRYSSIYNIRNLIFKDRKRVEEIEDILRSFEMESLINKRCGELSGGQRQRCAIARAIYSQKETLLADEPISALDEYLTEKSLKILNKNFSTIIAALHNVDVATRYFDRVIGIRQGKIVIDKKCQDLSNEDREILYESFDEKWG